MTRELVTITPYGLPQQWAAAFHAAAMRGIRYESRFTTAAKPSAAAVFGPAGRADWDLDESPRAGRDVSRQAKIRVLDMPRARSLRILPPPG